MSYIYFFHLTSPFSNFHPSRFEYHGYIFCSNEQFMMFSKAKTFKDETVANEIMDINKEELIQKFLDGEISSKDITSDRNLASKWNELMNKIKKLGRKVKDYNEEVWVKKREKIVLFGARLKFSQNQDLKENLMDTGDTELVEASPYDKIWGIGLSENEAKNVKPENWPGLNLLGKILDKLKIEFKNELTLKEINVLNFYHIGKKIPENGFYIGRANSRLGLKGSIFANPFPMKDNSEDERNRVIDEYESWIWNEIAEQRISKEDLLSLNGKDLVCYCAPKKCHGDILKIIVKLLINNEKLFDEKVNSILLLKNQKTI